MNMNYYSTYTIVKDIDLFTKELKQYKEYLTTSLYKEGCNGKLIVDSIIIFNKFKVDENGRFTFFGKNNVEFWFNEKIKFIVRIDRETCINYVLFFEHEDFEPEDFKPEDCSNLNVDGTDCFIMSVSCLDKKGRK